MDFLGLLWKATVAAALVTSVITVFGWQAAFVYVTDPVQIKFAIDGLVV